MQKYISNGLLALSTAVAFASCSKMDESFKQFVVPGGIPYVGKADSARVLPGRDRLIVAWLRGTDPTTKDAVIYWNNKKDSLVVPVTGSNKNDSVKALINLPENTYSFNIITRDAKGNRSIQVDVLGATYNTAYEAGLLSRAISLVQPKGATAQRIIRLGPADETCIGTEINYTKANGDAGKIYVPAGLDTALVESLKVGTVLNYRSSFKPSPLAIDSFWAKMAAAPVNLAISAAVTASSVSGTNTGAMLVDAGDRVSTNSTSFWQPLQADRTDDKKVNVVIDLGAAFDFNAVDHFWKTGNANLTGYTISYSNNGTTWQQCYAKSGALQLEERTMFTQVNARYVKLEWTIGTDTNLNVWEVEVYKR